MNDIRAKFEEIWPVPKGVLWSIGYGEYMPVNRYSMKHCELACEWDSRLDTFTRCQETTSLVMDHVSELIYELEHCHVNGGYSKDVVRRAKQIIGREK